MSFLKLHLDQSRFVFILRQYYIWPFVLQFFQLYSMCLFKWLELFFLQTYKSLEIGSSLLLSKDRWNLHDDWMSLLSFFPLQICVILWVSFLQEWLSQACLLFHSSSCVHSRFRGNLQIRILMDQIFVSFQPRRP